MFQSRGFGSLVFGLGELSGSRGGLPGRSRQSPRAAQKDHRARRRCRPWAEGLERRAVLATLTIANLNSSGPESLVAVFQQANTNGTTDTIRFASGLVGEIHLSSEVHVTQPVTFLGSPNVTISRSTDWFAFITQSQVTFKGVELLGGGIWATSGKFTGTDLLMEQCNGGFQSSFGVTSKLTNCVVANSINAGIINNGTATFDGLQVTGSVYDGVINTGTLTLKNSVLSGNNTGVSQNAISGNLAALDGTVTVTNTTISDGHTNGVYAYSPAVVKLNTGTIVTDNAKAGVFLFGGKVTTNGATISNNSTGILQNTGTSLTVNNSVLSGNTPGDFGSSPGVAILVIGGGGTTTTITDSQIVDNQQGFNSGGTTFPAAVVFTGGVATDSFKLSRSTVARNGSAGGIHAWGVGLDLDGPATVKIEYCTIAEQWAGGVAVFDAVAGTKVILTACTVARNGNVGVANPTDAILEVMSNIFWDNNGPGGRNVVSDGTIRDRGYNAIESSDLPFGFTNPTTTVVGSSPSYLSSLTLVDGAWVYQILTSGPFTSGGAPALYGRTAQRGLKFGFQTGDIERGAVTARYSG